MFKYFSAIFISLLLLGCQRTNEAALQGNWVLDYNSGESDLWLIHFEKEAVRLMSSGSFEDIGTYQIENDNLVIKRNSDDFEVTTKVKITGDAIQLFDSLVFHRTNEVFNEELEPYKLIGIESNEFYSSYSKAFAHLHYYKSEDNELKLRAGEKLINFNDLSLFLERGHSQVKALVYLGEGIDLPSLKRLYLHLKNCGHQQVYLATKRKGLTDFYVFRDPIEFWQTTMDSFALNKKFPILPPQLPPDYLSKREYLSAGAIDVNIKTKADFILLNASNPDQKMHISIHKDLPLDEYFKLKIRLNRLRKESKIVYRSTFEF